MAIKKFELKNEHILLLKNLRWSFINETNHIISSEKHENNHDEQAYVSNCFGGMDFELFEQTSVILYGKPQGLDLLKADTLYQYTQEQKDSMLQLLKELPTALEIVLSNQSFELGNFKMRLHEGIWNKYQPKVLNK